MARSSPQAGRREAEVRLAACAVASLCVVSCTSCVVAAVASLGSGSLGSAMGSDCAIGAIVPCRPALVSELAASDSAGSTTSDLRRPSGKRAGGMVMWRARHQWTTSQAKNGKESRAARIRQRASQQHRARQRQHGACSLSAATTSPAERRRRTTMMAPHFPPPNAATQQQLGINVTAHLQDGGSKSVYACVLVGGANNGLGAVVAIEATIQAAEPEAVRRLVSRPLHPNVIRGITHVHAAGPPGILYTVSEQLQVELFDNVINGGVILEGPARAQFAECVTALRHMHRMGVAHRDIKLENIMLSAQGGAAALLPPPAPI